MSLEQFDTSHWLIKDKAWMEERKAQWPAIEKVVGLNRRKTEVNVIKQYFLKGKLPKWEKYKEWDDYRPLDINTFLWLYPSSDFEVLKSCFKEFMESDQISFEDIVEGYRSFLSHEFMRAPSAKNNHGNYQFPLMGRKNILLLQILYEDYDYVRKNLKRFGKSDWVLGMCIFFLWYAG